MRRVLIVAYYFPPIAGIGSIRLASFARHLPEFGWEPVVVAPMRTPHPEDPSIPFPFEKVVRARSIEISRLARALPRRGGGDVRESSSSDRGARAIGRRYVYPDPQVGWFPAALLTGRRLLRRHAFDAVLSSSYPVTAHLVAGRLSRRGGLPWVAEWRDPWSDRLRQGHPHRDRAVRLEAEIATRASGVVMPSPSWAQHFGTRWGVQIQVIRNGHEMPAGVLSEGPAQATLVHLGSFYPGRQSLAPVWTALRSLADSRRAPLPRVLFIGDVAPALRAEAAEASISVEATGQMPHREALEVLAGSTMAFASGELGRDPVARGTIPAKLAEYLASGLPILYVGDPAGDAAALLAEQPGCHVAAPAAREAIASALEAGLSGTRHERDVEHLSRRAGARLLAAALDAAVDGG